MQCKSFSHFFNKNISVLGYKVVKHLTTWPLKWALGNLSCKIWKTYFRHYIFKYIFLKQRWTGKKELQFVFILLLNGKQKWRTVKVFGLYNLLRHNVLKRDATMTYEGTLKISRPLQMNLCMLWWSFTSFLRKFQNFWRKVSFIQRLQHKRGGTFYNIYNVFELHYSGRHILSHMLQDLNVVFFLFFLFVKVWWFADGLI